MVSENSLQDQMDLILILPPSTYYSVTVLISLNLGFLICKKGIIITTTGASGWLRQLSVQLFISDQAMISGW